MEYTRNSDSEYYNKNCAHANCGSFAFNIEEWYDPEIDFKSMVGYIDEWVTNMHDEGYSDDEIADIYIEAIAERVLDDFSGELREIYYLSDVNVDEELIALRGWCFYSNEYSDYDFHFKVLRNGIWQEKCGTQPIKFCLEDDWTYTTRTYNSITIYFAHKI